MSFFGDELRRLRRATGLSQETLAERAGLSAEAVSLLERGRRTPRVTTMRLLADAMDLAEHERSGLFSAASLAEPAALPLPVFADPLLGRAADLAALDALLARDAARVVTLLGPAGVGKSRIAVGYATGRPRAFPGGTYWLPLTSVSDRTGLLTGLSGALGLRGAPQGSLREVLQQVPSHACLLVLDDAEQHLDLCRELFREALTAAPRLTFLVASRHLTGAPGEITFPVAPLEMPPPGTPAGRLADFPACELFLGRASVVGRLDQSSADAVIRICQRLDGLPLALELAAARTNVLTVQELAEALEDELDLLVAPGPGGDQELVDAMVGWSYELLTASEQQIFARIGVFGDGFSRDAVAAVCGDGLSGVEVVQTLSSLVSKSLVERRDEGSAQARFRLLQLIREYARERLRGTPDHDPTRTRHAEYFGQLVEDTAGQLSGPEEAAALAVLDRETTNVVEAITWSVRTDPTLACRIVGALSPWVHLRGRYADGRRWADAALAAGTGVNPALRAPVLALAGSLAFLQCDYAQATQLIEQARTLHAESGNVSGVVWATSRLGSVAREQGRYDRSEALHREALRLARQERLHLDVALQINFLAFLGWLRGRPADAEPLAREALARMRALGDQLGVIWALLNLGVIARLRGDLVAAELLLAQCLELCEELSFREGLGWALNQLGVVARLNGELDRALGLQQAALAEHEVLGDRWRAASIEDELAALAIDRGDVAAAAAHLAAADRLRREIAVPLPAAERADRDRTVGLVQDALGSGFEATALAAGLDVPMPAAYPDEPLVGS